MTTSDSSATRMEFTLNGKPVAVDVEEGLTLLDLLRDRLGVMSPKNGCQPMGQCGCCTVLDRKSVV